MIDTIRRLAAFGVWTPPVSDFLQRPATVAWLERAQRETQRSVDEIVLLLLAAMRSLDLTVLDGAVSPPELEAFLTTRDPVLRELCQTKHVQANVAERGLPILEVLGQRWKRQRLSVLELGCSFGLLGRVLVSAPTVLERFDRYFALQQQRPTEVALVTSYHGIDLDPPDERWFLSCIPVAEMRTRMARLIYEVPADVRCRVTQGSAFDFGLWPKPTDDEVPVVLTSFLLYQLSGDQRTQLVQAIQDYLAPWQGTWINLDLRKEQQSTHFVVQEDGRDRLELRNDLAPSWKAYD